MFTFWSGWRTAVAATKGWPTVDLSNRHFYPSQGYKNNSLEAYGDYYPTYQKWALCLLPHSLLPSAAACVRAEKVNAEDHRVIHLCILVLASKLRLFNCWSSASILALGPHSLHCYFWVRSKLSVRPFISKPPRSWRRKVVPDVTSSPPRQDSGEPGPIPPGKKINQRSKQSQLESIKRRSLLTSSKTICLSLQEAVAFVQKHRSDGGGHCTKTSWIAGRVIGTQPRPAGCCSGRRTREIHWRCVSSPRNSTGQAAPLQNVKHCWPFDIREEEDSILEDF